MNIDRNLLQSTAHRILVADLRARGNVLSEMHSAALHVLLGAMADYAAKADQGRKAVALPTGMGKTSAIVAFILALEELRYEVPVAVATSKVEALCILKRELVARGVPEQVIGLKHRIKGASLPSTGDDDRRYMLVTHSRVTLSGANGKGDYELFGKHLGQDRALMVWDETLMRSEATGVDVRTLRASSAASIAYEDGRPELVPALAYLRECSAHVDEAMARLRGPGDPDARGADLNLPERTADELKAYKRAVAASRIPPQYVCAIADLFDLSQEPLRVLAVGTSEGLIWSRECVPSLLRNVLVLDASYPIRSLIHLDDTITEVETFPASALKRFDDVRVVQLLAAGGRSSITRSKVEGFREESAVVREVVDIVKQHWSTARGILVFTFKKQGDGPDHQQELRQALKAAGLDPDTPVATDELDANGQPVLKAKVQGLTYGQETSLNGFEFCDVVVLAGVLHRSELDIAAAMKGQMGDLAAPTPGFKVKETIRSEVAHVIYQALSRGSCRRVTDGRAHPMTAYVIHRSKRLSETLEAVMPGAAWEHRTPRHLKPANAEDIVEDMAAAILDQLRKVPAGIDSVSCRSVSQALGIDRTHASRQAFTRGGKLVESFGAGWEKVGQAFKRGAARYGFQAQ